MAEQSQQEGTTTRTLQNVPMKQSTDFTMVYANSVYFAMLPWDLTVIFGQVVSVDPNNPYVEQRVAVTLSPQTAKLVLDFLARNVAAYEQQYGEIRFTASIQESTEEPSA